MYTALTIGVSVIGLMIAVRWGSRKKFLHFLLLAAVSGGALLDFVLFFIDRANWTIPRALFAIPFVIFLYLRHSRIGYLAGVQTYWQTKK